MKVLRRVLAGAGILAIAVYAGAIAWLMTHETQLIFVPRQALTGLRPKAPFEEVRVPGPSGARHLMWIIRSTPDKPWLIFLHGNDSNLSSRLNVLHYDRLRDLGLNVLAAEYRGFAGVEGTPTEAGVTEDARAAYDEVRRFGVPPQRVIIYGWSLGTAVAVNLAATVDESAVILEGAPASIVAIGEQRYPFFPVRRIIRNPFESILKIGQVHAPVLFLHSPEDAIIPIAEGRRLYEAARPPKQFVEVAGGHVYASERDPAFFPAVKAFLESHRLLP
jgi:fermentation-respiration switch protein FrsA (DUF1100 family)